MPTNYPNSLDSLTNPTTNDPVNDPSHAGQHANANDAIEALQSKVGTNNSAVTTSLDYRIKQLELSPVSGNLVGLSDVLITNISNNDLLAYETSSEKWKNKTFSNLGLATQTFVNTAITSLSNASDQAYIPQSALANVDGVATLDSNAQVPLNQLGNLISGAPTALDTLNELAAALGNNPNLATDITTSLGTKVSKGGGDIITSSLPSVVPLRVRGAASQTANLQEWQNSSGNNLASIAFNGDFFAPAVFITYGRFGSASFTDAAALRVGSYHTSFPTSVIKALASQTSNLTEWQDSTGAVLSSIGPNGTVTMGSVSSSNIATFYNGTNGFGAGHISYNGEFNITGLKVGFPYNSAGAVSNFNAVSASSIPVAVKGYASQTADLQQWQNSNGTAMSRIDSYGGFITTVYASLYPSWAGGTPLFVSGLAGQTGNLTEWKNSAGTVLAKIDASGSMFTTTATAGTSTTQVATTAFVQTAIDYSVQPGALYQADAPTSPEIGQLWIESDSSADTFDPNIIRRSKFTATSGQTNFIATVPFIDGYEQVYFNGLLLLKTTDYTTSGGNTVILSSAAAAGDILEIVTVTNLNSVNTYTQAEINALLDANTSVAPLSISSNTNLVAKKRYFVTSASALTLTLPASPVLNDEIQIVDASGNASTYNITVARNGNLINGNAGNLIIDNNGGWYTLLYTGNTYGWKVG